MNFEQYHKIKRLGDRDNEDIFTDPEDEIIIEEKIDGGNFRFYITEDNKIVFGSRTQQLTSDEGEDTNVAKGFRSCVDFVRDSIKDKDLSDCKGMIFYGECCIKHTMNYNWETIPRFLGFDIKVFKENEDTRYLDYDMKKVLFMHLGLQLVPLVRRCSASDIKEITDADVPKSYYFAESNQDQKAEGIVFKNYEKGLFAKYVRDAFKEKNSEAFGGTPKYNKIDDTDNAVIVFKYCTNPRIDKMIFKLMDEGNKLEMKMMEHLPKRIYADIMEEEGNEILNSRWKVDFGSIRKLITKRCVAVLKQVLVNNALK